MRPSGAATPESLWSCKAVCCVPGAQKQLFLTTWPPSSASPEMVTCSDMRPQSLSRGEAYVSTAMQCCAGGEVHKRGFCTSMTRTSYCSAVQTPVSRSTCRPRLPFAVLLVSMASAACLLSAVLSSSVLVLTSGKCVFAGKVADPHGSIKSFPSATAPPSHPGICCGPSGHKLLCPLICVCIKGLAGELEEN